MAWKCKLFVTVILIVSFLLFISSVYYHFYPTDADIPIEPLDTLKMVVEIYERLETLDDQIPILEKEFYSIEGDYKSQIQPKLEKKSRLLLKIQDQFSLIEKGFTPDHNVMYHLNKEFDSYSGDPAQINFVERFISFKDKRLLAINTLILIEDSVPIIYDGIPDLYDEFGLGLDIEHEDMNETLPTLNDKAKIRKFLTQLLEDYSELEQLKDKIILEMIRTNYSAENKGDTDMDMSMEELKKQFERPEIKLGVQARFVEGRINETISSNEELLQNAVPFIIIDKNDKFERFRTIHMKFRTLEIQLEQKLDEHGELKDDLKKLDKIITDMDQKNKNSKKKTEFK